MLGTMTGNTQYPISAHARTRMRQRNISEDDLKFVVGYGQLFHRAGAVLYHLRKKDIPVFLRRNSKISRLIGTTVVLNNDHTNVLTVWRNSKSGLDHIRRKPE